MELINPIPIRNWKRLQKLANNNWENNRELNQKELFALEEFSPAMATIINVQH